MFIFLICKFNFWAEEPFIFMEANFMIITIKIKNRIRIRITYLPKEWQFIISAFENTQTIKTLQTLWNFFR